jgi:hypothetical protein
MMNILRYIQGFRQGKDAHDLEREAMEDPFLYEAIDGFDLVDDDHAKRVKKLQKQISSRLQNKKHHKFQILSLVASVLVIVALSTYFLFPKNASTVNETASVQSQIDECEDLIQSELTQNSEQLLDQSQSKQKEVVAFVPPLVEKKIESEKLVPEESLSVAADYGIQEESASAKIESSISDKKAVNDSIRVPVPVIGARAYNYYLERNIRILDLADDNCNGGKGTVILLFHVNEKGRPYNISVFRSLCQSADKEAARLLREGPDWTIGDKEVKLEIIF